MKWIVNVVENRMVKLQYLITADNEEKANQLAEMGEADQVTEIEDDVLSCTVIDCEMQSEE